MPAPGQSRLQIETSTDHTVYGDRDNDKVTITGRLVGHDGPLAGQPVTLYADADPTTWTPPAFPGDEVRTLTTDASGTIVFTEHSYSSAWGWALRYAGTAGIAGSDSATVVVAVLVPTAIILNPLVPVADGYQLRGRVSIYDDDSWLPSPTVEVWTSSDQQSWTRSQVVTGDDDGGTLPDGEPVGPGFTLTIPKTQGGYLQVRYLGSKADGGWWDGPTTSRTMTLPAPPAAGVEVPAAGQSRLQIVASTDHTADGAKFTITGRLLGHDGPLTGQPVALYADANPATRTPPTFPGDTVQTLTTDASGTVVFTVHNHSEPWGWALRYTGTDGIAGSDSTTVVVAVLKPTTIGLDPLVPVPDGYQLRGSVLRDGDTPILSPTVEVWTSPNQQRWTRSQVVTGDTGGGLVNGEPVAAGFTVTIPKTQGGYLQIRYLGDKQISGSPGVWVGPAISSTVTLPPTTTRTAIELAVPDPIPYAKQVSAIATIKWAEQPTRAADGFKVTFRIFGQDGQTKEGTAVTGSDGVARFPFTATASSTMMAAVPAGQQVGGRTTALSTAWLHWEVTRDTDLDVHARRRLAKAKSGIVTGLLTWAGTDTAVAGQPVQLWSRTRYHTWHQLDTAATDNTGRVTFTVRQNRTTDYRLRYRGSNDPNDPNLDTTANPTRSKVTVVRTSHRHGRR